jgi:hypothetical protein
MRAGLATLDVLENESLGERAVAQGELLRRRLQGEVVELAENSLALWNDAPGLARRAVNI